MLASVPFLVCGIIGINEVGPHPVAIGLGVVGLVALGAGLYYGLMRIQFSEKRFVVYPGRKHYTIEDIRAWKMYEDTDAEPGYRRHLELRFDRWYRRYLLLEEDVSPQTFDRILELLHNK